MEILLSTAMISMKTENWHLRKRWLRGESIKSLYIDYKGKLDRVKNDGEKKIVKKKKQELHLAQKKAEQDRKKQELQIAQKKA